MAQKKPDAEEILRKSAEDMSDIERMMADILQENGGEAPGAQTKEKRRSPEEREAVYSSPAPPQRKYVRAQRPPETKSVSAEKEEADAMKNRRRDMERERSIRDASRRRSSTIAIVVLVLIILLVLGSIIYTKVF